ncbi:hypothetical protein [Alicyclobacillus sp. ALC3]|uniref:hypothetical protein n=1 Tax=Alicyclobacillus sp. ALC3 TaxID=2796143 RepID=UPI0023785FD6|nr:hypothetical protein [Alicyclobacillus sp. ALC3]WDL99746.1 hypothetical protein JC200_23520 [Alicyclobacillus sp. ALC3]
MSFKKFVIFSAVTAALGTVCAAVQPAMALTSSPTHSSHPTYTVDEVQDALRDTVENHYNLYKDKPVKYPEHSVSQVKVLYFIQHDEKVILVGSCQIDRKEHIITGTFGRDRTTGKLVGFSGGWVHRETVKGPLYWSMGADEHEADISGVVLDKSIVKVRVTPIPHGSPVLLSVNPKGYFAAVVPLQGKYRHAPRLLIEGLGSSNELV